MQFAKKAQEFGLEMQSWGDDKLCIRAIPAHLPQFNLRLFVQHLNAITQLDELNWTFLSKSCQVTSYDLQEDDLQALTQVLQSLQAENRTAPFAKILDAQQCRKLFS